MLLLGQVVRLVVVLERLLQVVVLHGRLVVVLGWLVVVLEWLLQVGGCCGQECLGHKLLRMGIFPFPFPLFVGLL